MTVAAHGLIQEEPPNGEIKAGKFGRCGKMIIKPFSIPEEERAAYLRAFFRWVDLRGLTIYDCWHWQGRIHNGYPSLSGCPGGSTKWAHRVSYALFKGPIAEGRHIDHKCRSRDCVNPAHLKQTTPQQNYEAAQRRRRRDIRLAHERAGQKLLF